jgi:ribosomal-protein-alanine N-acetyltransferase
MTDAPELRFTSVDRSGIPTDTSLVLDAAAQQACEATAALYEKVGFVPPWLGYLAVLEEAVVGICGFAAPPANRRVEIAYFTFPGFEGKGIATSMARELVDVARRADPAITVTAQTLAESNASTRILEKLGFKRSRSLIHPEEGEVWEWTLD